MVEKEKRGPAGGHAYPPGDPRVVARNESGPRYSSYPFAGYCAAVSEENVEIVRRAIDAFNRGDLAEALAEYAPEVEWHTSGEFADQRVYRGHAGIERLRRELTEDMEGLRLSASEIQAVGDKVFVTATLRGRGKRSGAAFEQPFWYAVTFRDRLIVRVATYLDREQALEAAGLSE